MGDYLDNNKPMGIKVKRLLAFVVSQRAIPAGGGFGAGLDFLLDPQRMRDVSRAAMAEVEQMLNLVKAAPDNPYHDDEEIAQAILSKLGEVE